MMQIHAVDVLLCSLQSFSDIAPTIEYFIGYASSIQWPFEQCLRCEFPTLVFATAATELVYASFHYEDDMQYFHMV